MGDVLERSALHHGAAAALCGGTRNISHRDYRETCLRLGNALAARGIVPQDRVAILMNNGIDMIFVFGAAETHGFIAVPLNWRLAGAEILRTVDDAQPAAIVFDPQYADIAAETIRRPGGPRVVLSVGGGHGFAENLTEVLASAPPDRPARPPRPAGPRASCWTRRARWRRSGMRRSRCGWTRATAG